MQYLPNYTTQSLSEFYTGTAIPNAPKHTGRLPLSGEEEKWSVPKATLYAPEPSLVPARMNERIQWRHTETPLNTLFFSQGNIDNLQDKIRATVKQMVNADIDRQSDDDLFLIMRSYYLQYAMNNPNNVAAELEDLNNRVVSFAANRIAVEVEGYRYYRKDIMDFPPPIANPIDTHIYGTRTGELKSFF
jgi:Family of unknown function (DUF5761)